MVSDALPAPNSLRSATVPTQSGTAEQFLRFYLVPEMTVLLPISQLTEVLSIPIGQIVPIPHMPPWVMGVYNWRGEILWMVDLGQLVGLTPWYQQAQGASVYEAVVLHGRSDDSRSTKDEGQMLGLVVSHVEDIEWCNPDLIKSLPSSGVPPEMNPFLRGYWLKSDGEMLVVLDGEAIAAAMPKP